jgi:hypothetical protein
MIVRPTFGFPDCHVYTSSTIFQEMLFFFPQCSSTNDFPTNKNWDFPASRCHVLPSGSIWLLCQNILRRAPGFLNGWPIPILLKGQVTRTSSSENGAGIVLIYP